MAVRPAARGGVVGVGNLVVADEPARPGVEVGGGDLEPPDAQGDVEPLGHPAGQAGRGAVGPVDERRLVDEAGVLDA
jgi:hypothetical protein